MSLEPTKHSMPGWLKVAFGALATIVLAATAWISYRAYSLQNRQLATIASLHEELGMWRRSDLEYAPTLANQIETTTDLLAKWRLSEFDEPYLYGAFLSPAPEAFPRDAPILTLLWLENRFDVDGFDLYIDGKLKASVSGWKQKNVAEVVGLNKVFGNRYDRFIYVDIPTNPEHKVDNNRDVVRLSKAELKGKLEIQLRLDKPCGSRLPVLVAEEVN